MPLPSWLPPPELIGYVLDRKPDCDRLTYLTEAEEAARQAGDDAVLRAIAAWRFQQQLKDDTQPA